MAKARESARKAPSISAFAAAAARNDRHAADETMHRRLFLRRVARLDSEAVLKRRANSASLERLTARVAKSIS